VKYFVLMLVVVFFAIPGCRAEDEKTTNPGLETLSITRADGHQIDLVIETADTPQTRTVGLMFRKFMPKDNGMLFLFDEEEERAFWMRNTLIPLDMIFIKKDGVIRHIHANAIPHDDTPVPSDGPASAVLEINGGRAAELGLKPGDVVHHARFGNELAVHAAIH
jgi:uncharacterized membrane protein (UPF0127 family)